MHIGVLDGLGLNRRNVMVLENLHVQHKSFGEGVVVSQSGQYFTVKFASTEKIFVYPDIFEKFLTLADGTVSEDILNDIKLTKEAKQKILDKKHEENYQAMTKGIVIPGKENLSGDFEDEETNFKSADSEEI